MALNRLVPCLAIIGGGSAFAGWVVSEYLAVRQGVDGGRFGEALTCSLVGGAIGVGLNLVAGMTNGRWKRQAMRALTGLITGGFAGALGGSVGHFLFNTLNWDRAIGWTIMGAGIGSVEGLYERSTVKLRQGVIGGAVGGLAGGQLFAPVVSLLSPLSVASGRAAAFFVLGACVGVAIALVKVMFTGAWLTVLGGYRPGRRLLLSEPTVVLGRAEYADMPFTSRDDDEVDMEHARIVRLVDGRYAVEDNHSRHGTSVNFTRVLDRVTLGDGDVIRIGRNSIHFSARPRRLAVVAAAPASVSAGSPTVPATPPVSPAPRPMPGPAAAPPTRPSAMTPLSPSAPPPPGMSLCPGCRRPVPGPRPYCMICDLSF